MTRSFPTYPRINCRTLKYLLICSSRIVALSKRFEINANQDVAVKSITSYSLLIPNLQTDEKTNYNSIDLISLFLLNEF